MLEYKSSIAPNQHTRSVDAKLMQMLCKYLYSGLDHVFDNVPRGFGCGLIHFDRQPINDYLGQLMMLFCQQKQDYAYSDPRLYGLETTPRDLTLCKTARLSSMASTYFYAS